MPLPSQVYLWDQRTLYIGPLSEPLNLSQGAATLAVSLDHPIAFKTPDMADEIECHSLLLPPGLKICVNTRKAIVVNCNLEPMGSDLAAFTEQMSEESNKVKYNLTNKELFQDSFRSIYEKQMNATDAYQVVQSLVKYASDRQTIQHKIDPRILSVIDNIKTNVDHNISIEELAASIHLSVPRLVQLFKQQTGVPIRRYRLWHRLFVTATNIGKGNSLTDAAVAAGFADSAHFSHSFRSMLGMKPSLILSQPNSIRINVS